MKVQLISTTAVLLALTPVCWAQEPQVTLKLQGEQTITIPVKDTVAIGTNGDITVIPVDSKSCQTANSCEGVSVTVESFSDSTGSKTITVSEGDSFELDWRSSGAERCFGEGSYPAWQDAAELPADGRDVSEGQNVFQTAIGDAREEAYELRLVCANGSITSEVTSTATISLTVEEFVPPSPDSCKGRDPIETLGWTRLTTGPLSCLLGDKTADCRQWSPNLWPSPFLDSGSLTRKILTNISDAQQYVAIQFSTAGMSPKLTGGINFYSAGGAVRKEPMIVTISKCQGDFNPDQVTECYFKPRSNFQWRGPDATSSATCVLEPDEVYYLNMLSSESPFGTLPQDIKPSGNCQDAACGVLLQKSG